VNKISSLQDFRCCPQLSELYLRKNEIADIREVLYLQGLKNLSILWLCDNPCVGSSAAEYRQKVIALLPRITKLVSSFLNQSLLAVQKAQPCHSTLPSPCLLKYLSAQ
jgi:hypothetical protein